MMFSDDEKMAAQWLKHMNWNIWGSINQYREQILRNNIVEDAPSDEGKLHLLLAIMAGCHFAHMIELSEEPEKIDMPNHNTYPALLAIQHKADINIVTVSDHIVGGLFISAIWQYEEYQTMLERMVTRTNGNKLVTKTVPMNNHMLRVSYVHYDNAAESMLYQPTWDRVGDDEDVVKESVDASSFDAFTEFLGNLNLDDL